MAHTISTAKRNRQNLKRKIRNRALSSRVATHEKAVAAALKKQDKDAAKKALTVACQTLDKAAKQGVLHANSAARKKSRLARQVNELAKK